MLLDRGWEMRIEDILTSIKKIQAYIKNMTYEQFRADNKTVDAVIRNLEVIGEAARHIPLDIQEKYPKLGWLEMRGMRNIVAHEYFGVSLPIVWHTITHDLQPLAAGLRRILQKEV